MEHVESTMMTLVRVTRLMFVRCHAWFDEIGIYPGQHVLLLMLMSTDSNNGISQKEVARMLEVRPATAAVTLKRMEKNGFICRNRDEKDRRIVRVSLTGKGREAGSKLKDLRDQLQQECFQGFTEEEIDHFQKMAGRIADNINNVGLHDGTENDGRMKH